jgi:hypothetical protein
MSTRKIWSYVLTCGLVVGLANPPTVAAADQAAPAAVPAIPGFLPATATPHGYSLTDLATAWLAWGFGTPPSVNPLVALRCEQSPLDRRIWFLPAALGGEGTSTCYVPQGSFLVLLALAMECSQAEGNGSTLEELKACNDTNFEPNTVEVTFKGETVTDLTDYIVTTALVTLPAYNLFGVDPTLSMMKGYFLVLAPLSRGTHTLHASGEFPAFPFQAGVTYTIVVR